MPSPTPKTEWKIPRRRKANIDIDLSPLIDCVFQLLVFFLLSSTLLAPALDLKLPTADGTGDPVPPEILITVDAEGEFYLNGEAIDPATLPERLPILVEDAERKVISFQGDENMPHRHFVLALDAAKKSGAKLLDVRHETPNAAEPIEE